MTLENTNRKGVAISACLSRRLEFRWRGVAVIDFTNSIDALLVRWTKLFRFLEYKKREHKMLYCVRREERESFKALFWTIPFDFESWILIVVSGITLTFYLTGQWYKILGILLRQGYSIPKDKQLLTIFVFVTIVLTCSYESIISSVIMVPSPVIIFDTVWGLYLGGYKKLTGVTGEMNGVPATYDTNRYAGKVFLTLDQSLSFTTPDLILNKKHLLDTMSQANVTYSTGKAYAEFLLYSYNYVEEMADGVKCYTVKEVSDAGEDRFVFGGPELMNLYRVARHFFESGLMITYYELFRFVSFYPEMRDIERVEYIESHPEPFRLREWRILSIFVGWAALFSLALVIFILECFSPTCVTSLSRFRVLFT